MGSLFDLLDLNRDFMARKATTHKRHGSGSGSGNGLEAPRNSMELPMEKYLGLYTKRDNILYAHHLTKGSSAMDYYSSEAPIKKLISGEISKRPTARQNGPSVVARLMGVDTLPFDSKPAQPLVSLKNERPIDKLMDKQRTKSGSGGYVLSSNCSLQPAVGSFDHYAGTYPDQASWHMKLNKPKRREHPQEEELQKFKKEFEAWQAARFTECSNLVKSNSDAAQLIAQQELNREKMLLHSNSQRITDGGKLQEYNNVSEVIDPHEMLTFGSYKKDLSCSAEWNESLYSNRMSKADFRTSQIMSSDRKIDNFSAPSKIVILRPGPERMNFNEDSWYNTPSVSDERGNIQDFLEEVKERLKSELQGKPSKRSTTARGGGIETPYREMPSEQRKTAQRIAQDVRNSVSRDFGTNLLRSESTRSYRSETRLNETGSPKLNRDTRRALTERLRNVLSEETHKEAPMDGRCRSRLSMSDYEKCGVGQSRDTWIHSNTGYPDRVSNEIEKQSRSFRGEPTEGGGVHLRDMSPRNLIRSLSAPASGTSFGKLLLEDRNVLTGAQIRRKHEIIEKVSLDIKKQKKEKFNIREKVSSFRYSLTLRGRLFRKGVKSLEGLDQNRNCLLNDLTNGPTVMMSSCEANENSTEVPPSPASVCSSVHEELGRPADYLSPVSSTGATQMEDSDISHVFREINSNLTELKRKLNQFEGSALEEATDEHRPNEVELDIEEDHAETYVRDLLIAAGLYDGSYSLSLAKWDPLGKPISPQVFEEVEESYRQSHKNDDCIKDQDEKENHKMILDLLNEVLPTILREPPKISRYMEKIVETTTHKPPHGRKLLSNLWNTIRVYTHPPSDRSHFALDNMLARDLKSVSWSRFIDDDVSTVGREIEYQIIGNMIEDIVKDMYSFL